MTKFQRNDIGSVVLDRAAGNGNFSYRIWTAFSVAAFRRKLLDAVTCGISRHRDDEDLPEEATLEKTHRSEKLSELLKLEVSENGSEDAEAETRRKVEVFEELRNVVKRLQVDYGDRRAEKEAAVDVRRLAKEDSEARETLAMLGAIPPLIGMLDLDDPDFQIASLYALLNLGIGNDMNKAAIVKAGALHKILKLLESTPERPIYEAIVANLLGLSALDSNKPIIGASGAIPFLVKILQNADTNDNNSQAKQDALRALFNLSIAPSNTSQIVESGLVQLLLNSLGEMESSERALSIIGNLIATSEGRKAIRNSADSFPILIDVLNWSDSPGCQEKACYILMVMAHKSYADRTAMIEAGVASALLELTLLGSTLSQKRASRILECMRVDKGKQVSEGVGVGSGAAVSAPIYGASTSRDSMEEDDGEMMSEERKAVKQLVQQSLQNNMRRIAKRANLLQDFAPSDRFQSLTATSTSKSLPF